VSFARVHWIEGTLGLVLSETPPPLCSFFLDCAVADLRFSSERWLVSLWAFSPYAVGWFLFVMFQVVSCFREMPPPGTLARLEVRQKSRRCWRATSSRYRLSVRGISFFPGFAHGIPCFFSFAKVCPFFLGGMKMYQDLSPPPRKNPFRAGLSGPSFPFDGRFSSCNPGISPPGPVRSKN